MNQFTKVNIPASSELGRFYKSEVPDTLDLEERARYALNVLTRAVIPSRSFACWQIMSIGSNPAFFSAPNWLSYKWLEAIPRMRMMCGDETNLEIEREMMQAFVNQIGEKGLLYYPSNSIDNPPDTAYVVGCARIMLAMAAWYDRDGDAKWIELIGRMSRGLAEIAIKRFDYAYYPLESGYSKEGEWKFTIRGKGGKEYFPYTPPDEPSREQQGHEGTVKFDMGTALRGVLVHYRLTGDEQSLEMASKLANFCLLPTMWEANNDWGTPGHEHGVFAGHFHGNTMALRALLEYAVAVNDNILKNFVREGYEHARRVSISAMGWFPAWVKPESFGRPGYFNTVSETCGIGNMVALAVELSLAGVADYWDDVDSYVRNQLAEQQFIDLSRMKVTNQAACVHEEHKEVSMDLGATTDVIERTVGGFTMAMPSGVDKVSAYGCCTGNGSLALYYAWKNIIHFKDGTATVNLWLNRTSPWVDIDSFLPFEGKIRMTNKCAHTIFVRIPRWVDNSTIRVMVNGNVAATDQAGRYLIIEELVEGDVIETTCEIPIEEHTYSIAGTKYRVRFKGSTVIDILPRLKIPVKYDYYLRDHMMDSVVPIKQRNRYAYLGR